MLSKKETITSYARLAESAAKHILDNLEVLQAEELRELGTSIERSGVVIKDESVGWVPTPIEPPVEPPVDPPTDPVEPPVEPPIEPDPNDPPAAGGPIVIPDINTVTTIHKTGGAGISVNKDNQIIKQTKIEFGEWMGISVAKQDPTNGIVGLKVDECEFITGWNGDHKGWGIRGYDMAQFHIRNSSFVCTVPKMINVEHGKYCNIYGGGMVEGCFFLNWPGQALQWVWAGRESESANFVGLSNLDVAGDLVHVLNCEIHNCGSWNGGRASYAISMFKGQVGLKVENTLVQKLNEPQSKGALLFEGAGKQNLAILNSTFYYPNSPDRELIKCWDAANVLIDGGQFVSSKGVRFVNCKNIEIKNAKGNAKIWIGHTTPSGVVWDIPGNGPTVADGYKS